jgi:hypothetical protein
MPKKTKPTGKKIQEESQGLSGAKKRFPRPRLRRLKPETPPKKLTGAFRLFSDSMSLLRQHWRLFSGITLVYLILSLLLVGGLGEHNVTELKETFTEELGQTSASIAVFSLLLGTAGRATTESGAAYQTIVVILVSLATVWSLRQVLAGERVGIRDAFYKGMYPLVPFVLVLLFLCVLLLPAIIGGFILSIVFGGGLAVSLAEMVLWAVVIFLLTLASLYLLSTYVFAIYIVTLPDVRPVAAIKTARKLAVYQRWAIIRKLLFLPFALVILGAVTMLPLIALAPAAVQAVFLLLSMIALIFTHTYAYSLYKELL